MLQRFFYSITFKAIIIGIMALFLQIPRFMVQDLIQERQQRSKETIKKINSKWSAPQVVSGPVLSIPYEMATTDADHTLKYEWRTMNIPPESLSIKTVLVPEERYYGIYKAILYKSKMEISGHFKGIDSSIFSPQDRVHWEGAYLSLGISDLRGITQNPSFTFNNKAFEIVVGRGKRLIVEIGKEKMPLDADTQFGCTMNLNGSQSISFVPIARSTKVSVSGEWASPSFIGNFSPEFTIDKNHFEAKWNVLYFNRDIPGLWTDIYSKDGSGAMENGQHLFYDTALGVDMVDMVNHYQQSMRSAKYAFMFIFLTFLVFFFVETITKKRIHPIQYILVGFALILFYSLLLSISEHLNFVAAYMIASIAIVGLITAYVRTIFNNMKQTIFLASVLSILYAVLYMLLQLEDIALLVGSISLFVILGIVMYFSRKINWYRDELLDETEVESEKK